MNDILEMCKNAKEASRIISSTSKESRREVLAALVNLLVDRQQEILSANEKDQNEALAHGLSSAMIERLQLSPSRIGAMGAGIEKGSFTS